MIKHAFYAEVRCYMQYILIADDNPDITDILSAYVKKLQRMALKHRGFMKAISRQPSFWML